ncbi:hypothetical protein SAMN04487948_11735 [Halogranum amylolyticum]|uniref:Uncharacterized protein n=1 Tax=Halogranum amylolyticum TaxID=660520 RepID=A0A1H8VJN4_9EURY|nr:hypothetical protein SAMN04487948_11735 [Halogranum amylolyticum]
MPTQLARFTDNCVDLSQKAVVGEPQPPLELAELIDGEVPVASA